MIDYELLYHVLFNAVTDALTLLDQGESLQVRSLLRQAQQRAEELYLTQSE
jgi:hypothetical protein